MKRLVSVLARRAGCVIYLACIAMSGLAQAQGQDSTPTERDSQVIAELLARIFDNYNQVYFNRRLGHQEEERHDRLEIRVDRIGGPDSMLLAFRRFADGDYSRLSSAGVLVLAPDNDRKVTRMEVWALPHEGIPPMQAGIGVNERPETPPDCVVNWTREAAQFRGQAQGHCPSWAVESVLSEQQLWLTGLSGSAHPGGPYELHAARMMQCYIDIPGVSGGRDEEYKRYDNLKVHDRGGVARITTKDGRELGIRLSNVDWPLNNYAYAFTRDVLVLYVLEFLGEEVKSHGYIFTEPHAERIGINLYWILSYCYLQSNTEVRPFM